MSQPRAPYGARAAPDFAETAGGSVTAPAVTRSFVGQGRIPAC